MCCTNRLGSQPPGGTEKSGKLDECAVYVDWRVCNPPDAEEYRLPTSQSWLSSQRRHTHTCMGVLSAQRAVKPTMSLKYTVTHSNCSGRTISPAMSCCATGLQTRQWGVSDHASGAAAASAEWLAQRCACRAAIQHLFGAPTTSNKASIATPRVKQLPPYI